MREWKRATAERVAARRPCTQALHPRSEPRGARIPLRVPQEGLCIPRDPLQPTAAQQSPGRAVPSSRSRATQCGHRAGTRPAPLRHPSQCRAGAAPSAWPMAPASPRAGSSTCCILYLSQPLGLRPAPDVGPGLGHHACARLLTPMVSGRCRQTGHCTAAPSPAPSAPARLLSTHPLAEQPAGSFSDIRCFLVGRRLRRPPSSQLLPIPSAAAVLSGQPSHGHAPSHLPADHPGLSCLMNAS